MSMIIRGFWMLMLVVWAGVGVAQGGKVDCLDQENAAKCSRHGEVGCLDQQAIKCVQQGRYELAVQKWEEARSKLIPKACLSQDYTNVSVDSAQKYIDISLDQAAAYQSSGRLQNALDVLKCAESVTKEKIGEKSAYFANVLSQFTDVYLAMGNAEYKNCQFTGKHRQLAHQENLNVTLNYLQEALGIVDKMEIVEGNNDHVLKLLRANLLNKKGNLLMVGEKYEEALAKYRESLKYAGQDELLKAKNLVNIVHAAVKSAEKPSDDAVKTVKEAVVSAISQLKEGSSISPQDKLLLLTSLASFVRNLQKNKNFYENGFSVADVQSHLEKFLADWVISGIGKDDSVKNELVKSCDKQVSSDISQECSKGKSQCCKIAQSAWQNDAVIFGKSYLAEMYANDIIAGNCSQEEQQCRESFIEQTLQEAQSYPLRSLNSEEVNIANADSFVSKGFKVYLSSLQDEFSKEQCKAECQSICGKEYLSPCKQERTSCKLTSRLPEECKGICQEMPPLFLQGYHPEWLFNLQWQLGRIYKTQQRWEEAFCPYERAATYLQLVQNTYAYPSVSQTFRKSKENFYLDRADLLLQAANVMKNDEQNLLKAAIDSIESRQEVSLQNYFQDECVTQKSPKGKEKELQPGEALFYPIVFDDRIELVLKFSDGIIKREVSQIQFNDLQSKVNSFKTGIRSKMSFVVDSSAKKLYNWLIKPISNQLQNMKVLLVVPSSELLHVPFSALINEEDGKYLIESANYAFAILPSWKLVATANTTNLGDERAERALLSGLQLLPKYHISSPEKKIAPLKFVVAELHELTKILTYPDTFLDEDFTTDNLMAKGKQQAKYSIIHFSTHGEFVVDANKSILYTYDNPLSLDQLEDLIGNISYQPNGLDLLVLSACETALGAELGMAGIGIKAGSTSTLGTLWVVDEKSTALLTTLFYWNWKKDKTKAEALREAQLCLLTGSPTEKCLPPTFGLEFSDEAERERFKKPYYWASFLLIGDWLK